MNHNVSGAWGVPFGALRTQRTFMLMMLLNKDSWFLGCSGLILRRAVRAEACISLRNIMHSGQNPWFCMIPHRNLRFQGFLTLSPPPFCGGT